LLGGWLISAQGMTVSTKEFILFTASCHCFERIPSSKYSPVL
jgi:hypothetical protein